MIKLSQHYEESTYPKKGAHGAFAYNEKYRHLELYNDKLAPLRDVYGHNSFVQRLTQDAINEMDQVLKEEQPCKVMIANLGMLFWLFKGPGYNYGGLEKISKNIDELLCMNRNYATEQIFVYADTLREILENYDDSIFPKLKLAPDRQLYPVAERLYTKLMLLLYDLICGAVVYYVSGTLFYSKGSVTAYVDIFGDIRFSQNTYHYDDRQVEYKRSEDILGSAKYQAYRNCRNAIAQEVHKRDPGFPVKDNIWLFYKIDCDEITAYTREIYGIKLWDLTNYEKAGLMRERNKLLYKYEDFARFTDSLNPLTRGLSNRINNKLGVGQRFRTGKINSEEEALRQTISVL